VLNIKIDIGIEIDGLTIWLKDQMAIPIPISIAIRRVGKQVP